MHFQNLLYQIVLIFSLVLLASLKMSAQCPTIQFVDLRGTPGFPQTDDLNVCGQSDTLSVLIFTDAPGEVKGFEFTVNMVSGMRYAGFEEAHYGGCTDLSNSNPDVASPSFIAAGITCGDIFVANIGVTADCAVDLINNDYLIEIDYSYTYFPPTGGSIKCSGTETLEEDFNGALKVPVLNMFTPSPIDATIAALSSPACQTLTISQDGLQASVDEFEFAICGLDTGGGSPISISSMTANGIDILAGAAYNPADTSWITTVGATHFPGNGSTNPNGIPEQFDTAERVSIQVCYEVANCPETSSDIPFTYKAWYGCSNEICQTTGQAAFMKVRPVGSANPTVTAALDNGLTICGEDAMVTATIQNGNATDTDQFVYTDVSLGFQGCGLDAIEVTEVLINGISVPSVWEVIGDDIDIDLSMNTDASIGLVDYDGDGFFDDMIGGSAALDVAIKFNLGCGVGGPFGGDDCPTIACENVQFYISGNTNCGNSFRGFPTTDGFNLQYGQTAVSNPNEVDLNAAGSVTGYDFDKFSNDGAPIASIGASTQEIEFCYDFASENIGECPSGPSTRFEVTLAGSPIFIEDFEFVPGSAMFSNDGGASFAAVPDAQVSWTTNAPTNSEARLVIEEGTTDTQLCYKYQLTLNNNSCGPVSFVAVTQQVVSTCSDCTPDCDIVKACRNTLFRVDPESAPCACVAQYNETKLERLNLGYLDKEMTMRATPADIPAVDLRRFMPGDTIDYQGELVITTQDVLDDPLWWNLNWYLYPLTGSFTTADRMPLSMDAQGTVLTSLEVTNADGTTHVVNIADLPGCMQTARADFNSYDSNIGDYDWLDYTGDARDCNSRWYNSHDGFDNNYINLSIWNYDRMSELNATNPAVALRHTFSEGDCLNEFIAAYGIDIDSRIIFNMQLPLIKNPFRETAKIAGIAPAEDSRMRLFPTFNFYTTDDIAGPPTYGQKLVGSACRDFTPFFGSCPGDIVAETIINLDDCGGTVEHVFSVKNFAGPISDEWFTAEYRPLIELHDIELPIYAPTAYCANAKVTQNGVVTPITVDSTENMICSPVAGYSDNLCSVESGASGSIIFDLHDQGFSGLGIGLGNCDTIRITYDYCTICPAPIEGLLEYKMLVDWCYTGHQPDECSISAMLCTNSTAGTEATSRCDELGLPNGANYYNELMLDTLYCKVDSEQGVVFVDDSAVTPIAALSASNVDGAGLIASNTAGISVETKEIEFCNSDPLDALGLSGYVTVPNPVSFIGACADAAGTMPLTTTLVSDDGQVKKYQVDMPATMLANGECVTVFIKTTLLFCPTPGSLPPQICVGASSGCSPAAVRAAIGNGGGTCANSEVCYAYLFGEAGLQTEWFSMPVNPNLCEPMTLHVRNKNVKPLLLLGVDPNFTLPPGLEIVPNSWEVAYPGGSVDMTGNFGPWVSVSDPDDVNGNTYGWTNEATWSSEIAMNGFVGVEAALDSNNVSFRFQVTTVCDEFLSGSKASTETITADPCSPGNLSSGIVASPAIIIDGANPADFAQILAVGSPSELYCGGLDNTFGLTALNVSVKPTTDSVVSCVLIPGEYLTYTPGSILFTNGFVPAWITETPIGNDIEVCAHSPVLLPGESWSLTFQAAMREDAPCGEIPIGADIKSVVEAVTCVPGPPNECAVFVQNSLNPVILVDLKAPLETEDIRVSMDCTAGEDPVQICYEIDLSNPGPTYDGNVRVGIHDDVTANGVLESFDTELNGMDHAVNLAPGEMVTLTMCLDIAAIQSCPIIINQTYETDCACDSEATSIMDLSPSFIADLEECVVLCPTQPLELETCGGYEVTLDPAAGGVITDDGTGMLSIVLNDGFGIAGTDPVKLVVTGITGECEITDMIELKSLGDFIPEDQEADICDNDCVDLDLLIPSEFEDGATITWTPTIGLDDPTSASPEVCGLTEDQIYNVEIKLGESCVFNIEYVVTYNPNGVTTITGEEFCLCQEAGTLTGANGFASYEWYSIQSGVEILEAITTTNTYTNVTEPGDYLLKGFIGGATCPNISNIITLEGKECVDLELEKNIINIPSPLVIGSQITYELIVCNIEDESLGLKFDATNVEVSDELPGAVTYIQHNQSSGNYSPTINQWDISLIENGTCETLWIDVEISGQGMIENTAQISGSDQEDTDSGTNNDDGDQSEDDEDNATIDVILANIGDLLFIDADGDGIQDPGETGVEGATVTLFDAITGLPIATVMTDANGNYLFEDLPSGDYYIDFDLSTATTPGAMDYLFTTSGTGDGANDSEADANGTTPSFSFDATMGDDLTHDAGVIPTADLGSFVWVDTNGDGIQDPNEMGVSNVQVILFDATTGLPLDTVFTDANGMYLFEDLPAGDYEIVFDNSTASGAQDYLFTDQNTGSDANDSNVDASGSTGTISFDPLSGDDLTIDAGLVPVADIGNYVWIDADMNGLQDNTEMGVAGVTVILYDFNTGLPLDTVFTDANGMYLFTDVPEGDYFIEFDPSSSSLSNDFSFTGTDTGNGSNDSDASAGGFTSIIEFDPTTGDDLTIDAGLFPTANIGDTVWIDANGDGIEDPSEMGVAGVTVTLYDAVTGAVIATTLTDANGNYLFEDVPSGDYSIGYDTSTSTTPGVSEYVFTQTGGDSEADANGQGPSFNFDATMGDDLTHDAGIVPTANIGNYVWVDTDGDGIQDPNEMGVANAAVILYDANTGMPLDTVFTDANGEYLFTDVPAGDYYLEYDLSGSGIGMLEFTQGNAGGNDGSDSDVDANGQGPNFTFDPTMGDDLTHDAGIILVEGIGNFVWIDADGDGVQDPGEMGIEGVQVILYDSNTGLPLDTVFTDANGEYLFTGVPEGDYFIGFDISTNTAGVDYPFTESGQGNNNTGSDADSDGFTMSFNFDPSTGTDLSWDAGIVPSANIGDTVWIDADGDGIEDPSEMGVAGVTVTLYDAVTGAVIATTLTDANGNYLFENVPSGDYSIGYDTSTSTTPGVSDYVFTQSGGDSEADANGQGPSFSFDATMGDDLTHDAGIVPTADIGSFVWVDTDGDGIQDANEIGVANVPVILFDNVTGLPIDTVFTDANGEYLFEDVPAGDYFIVFDVASSGNNGMSLFTMSDSGLNEANDSDADANGQTMSFVFDPTMGDDLTIDAGIVPVNDIGNFVWIDADGDGIQDPGEMGVAGVTVTLFDANTGLPIGTAITDANGEYVFENIPEGDYFINFDLSTNTAGVDFPFTQSGAGNGVNDSDADALGNTAPFSFDPTVGPDLTWDAGIVPSANIGDTVWIDSNGDGIQDPSEVGVVGVTVMLIDAITGEVIGTVLTDANGNFLFEDIPSGDYNLVYDTSTSTTPGASDYPFTQSGGDSEADANGQGPSFSFDATMGDDLDHDAGLNPVADIGNFVWIDSDGDGIQDASEMGLENVMVILLDNLGNPIDTVFTDVNGEYVFEDVPAGEYAILFDTSTSNNGDYEFSPNGNGDGTNDSEADAAGLTPNFVFDPSSGDDLTHDAGLIPVANIGDSVFIDADGDGVQDAGEMGLEGVTVTLIDATTGAVIATVMTDANGNYLFEDIPAGDYFVNFDPSTSPGLAGGSEFSPTGNGNGATDSNAGPDGNTSIISFDPTMGDDLTIDAGIIPNADIGDFVFIDTDGDGIQDPNETGVEGVTVTLFDAVTGLPVATVMTDANGNYLFEDIPSGDYFIEFDVTTSEFGEDFAFATQNSGNPGEDSDADANGMTPVFSFDASQGDKLTCDAGIQPMPQISNVKFIVDSQINSDGYLEVVFGLGVKNTGVVDLTNLSLQDDLATQFGLSFMEVEGMTAMTNSSASSDPTLNTNFDGSADIELFNGSIVDLLEPNQEIDLEITVVLDPNLASFPLTNQTIAAGDGMDKNGNILMDGMGNALRVSDLSDSGRMHGDANAGEPGDAGTANDPTLIECFPANIIVTGDDASICFGEGVFLNVTSDFMNVQYQWREEGATTIISTSDTPTFTPLATTNYEVTLVVFDDVCVFNLKDTVTITVLDEINISVVASYTLNADCSPSDLSFEVLQDGSPSSFINYDWTGPNGFTSTDAIPIITNATAANNGNYVVSVIDIDGCIAFANVQILDVVDPENDPVIVSSGPACENDEIVLMTNAYAGSNVTYTWTTPAGVTTGITGQGTNILTINPVDSTVHRGTYSIEIVVDGCILNADFDVNTLSSPEVAASFTVSDACDDGSIELFANASGLSPLSYDWSGPNGYSSNLENPVVGQSTVLNNGQYLLSVTNGNGCVATSSITVSEILPALPPATISSNGPQICDGDPIELESSTEGVMFEWIGDSDSESSLLQPGQTTTAGMTSFGPGHSEYISGPWKVRVTDANGCTTESPTINIEIVPVPESTASNDGPICLGNTATMSASTLDGGIYRWYDGADPTTANLLSTNQNYLLSDLAIGSHTFYLQVELNTCFSEIGSTTVVIEANPTVDLDFDYNPSADCSASDLSLLSDASASPQAIATYSWTGPNGFTSNVANPVIINAGPQDNGSYTLVVTTLAGCSAVETIQINDVLSPVVNDPIITSSGPACEGESITLTTSIQTGTNVSYVWNVPSMDNVVGQGTNQIVIFPLDESVNVGDYSVTVMVDGCTTTSEVFTVSALSESLAIPSATSTPICDGDNLFLEANSPTGVSFAWSGPSGFTSDQRNPIVTLVTEGNNGIYTLIVSNAEGCTSVSEVPVNNILAPAEVPTIAVNGPNCQGEDLVLSTSADGTLFEWVGPLGASTSTLLMPGLTTSTPSTTLDSNNASYLSGDWRVQVTDANGCTSISEPIGVGINEVPLAIIVNNGDVCEGDALELSANAVDGAQYAWYDADPNTGGTLISQEQSIQIFGLTANSYTYFLQVEANGCASEIAQSTLVINSAPVIALAFDYTGNVDCAASDLGLLSTVIGDGPFEYLWSGPNGFTSNVANPVIINAGPEDNGSYTLVVTSIEGCTTVETIQINDVLSPAINDPIITSSGPACEGQSITLTTSVQSGTNVSYVWNVPSTMNVVGQGTNQIVIFPLDESVNVGDYSVTVMVDGCTTTSEVFIIGLLSESLAIPSATSTPICDGDDLFLMANSPTGVSFAWSGPSGFTSDQSSPVLTNVSTANNGIYTLTVSNAQGCSSVREIQVSVILPPVATPSIAVNDPNCSGQDVVFTTSATGVLFEWISPLVDDPSNANIAELTTSTGTTTIPSTSAAYVSGSWTVRVTDSNGCTATSEAIQLDINALPISVARNDGPKCEGVANIELLGNEVPNATYEWYLGDPMNGGTLFSTDMSTTVFTPAAGTTEYFLVVTQDGCVSAPSSTEVVVIANPESNPIAVYELSPDCSLQDLNLESNAIGAGPFTYLWTGPNNFISTEANPSILSITELGNGSYTLLLTDAFGCQGFSTVELNNISNPQAQPVISTSGISCDEGSIVLTTQAYFGTNVSYSWTTPNGSVENISGLNTNEITISPVDVLFHDGDYTLTVVVDDCTLTSAPFNLEVLAEPVAATPTAISNGVCVGEDILLQSEVASDYLWSGPNGFTSTLQFPVISDPSLAAAGTYFLTIFNEQGCRSDAVSIDITVDLQPETPTLSVANQMLCDGDMISLSTSSVCDEYQWIGPGGSSVTTLANPLLTTTLGSTIIPSEDEAYTQGLWSVICINGNGCASELSSSLSVEIFEPQIPTPVASQTVACEEEQVTLISGSGYDVGTIFTWYDMDPSIGSANIIGNQSEATLSDQLGEGEYTFYLQIEQNGCLSSAMPVSVTIVALPEIPVATNQGPACEGSDVELRILNPNPEFLYRWYRQLDNFEVGTGIVLILPAASQADAGGYYAIAENMDCVSEASNPTILEINAEANIIAFGGEDDIVCSPDYTLVGNSITESEGFWTEVNPNGQTQVLTPGESTTEVLDLEFGNNQFVWTVSSGACANLSTDTVTITYNADPIATDDIYTIGINEQLDDTVLNNDQANAQDFTISNFTEPTNGSLLQNNDGTFIYQPNEGFAGTDSYSYELCHVFCPDNCVEATVFITIGEDVGCFAPTIITPNGDGVNDSFTIPCLANFENSQMCIFNRWGDEVFNVEDYRNEWEGTYKDEGSTLPSGTYYYILRVNDGNDTVLTGYVFIQR